MRRNPMVRLHVLSFIPDTRPRFAAEFSLLGAWVWPGEGASLSCVEVRTHVPSAPRPVVNSG